MHSDKRFYHMLAQAIAPSENSASKDGKPVKTVCRNCTPRLSAPSMMDLISAQADNDGIVSAPWFFSLYG